MRHTLASYTAILCLPRSTVNELRLAELCLASYSLYVYIYVYVYIYKFFNSNSLATIGTPIYIVDGFNVTLVCHIASGTRPITIMWLHNNAPYPAGGNHSVITIPDTDYDDGDIFTCRADNIVGFDMENSIINVSSK